MQSRLTNETLDIIRQRRSVRDFKDVQVKDEEIQAVVEAGLYAPNAGDQAWHFTVVQNKEILKELNLAAKECARQMDGFLAELGSDENFECLYGAPAVIIVSGDAQSMCPEVDCAAATQNMLLAAESIGLGSCWVFFVTLAFGSAQGSDLRNKLAIPDGFKPISAAAIGYKNAPIAGIPDRKPGLITYIK